MENIFENHLLLETRVLDISMWEGGKSLGKCIDNLHYQCKKKMVTRKKKTPETELQGLL